MSRSDRRGSVDLQAGTRRVRAACELTRCEGKGDCLRVRPEHVFEVRRIDDVDFRSFGPLSRLKLRVHGMRIAYTPHADACRACGLCVTASPEDAITIGRAGAHR